MLEVAREGARRDGLELDLRIGDYREPPVEGSYPLVTIPFRALMHMRTDAERRAALRAARGLLEPSGRLVFDVFSPAPADIAETHGRWLEREPGISSEPTGTRKARASPCACEAGEPRRGSTSPGSP